MKVFLTTEELAEEIGCTKRQLQWWDEQGVLKARRGIGSRRYYNRAVIPEARVITRLRACNEPFRAIRKAVRGVVLDAPFYLYERGKSLAPCRTQHEVIDAMKAGSALILIELR